MQYVDIPGYAALILRRTYAELMKADGLIPRAQSWLAGTDAHQLEGGKKWVFPSGARLEFGHVQNEKDMHSFQSSAYQYVGFDELTSFTENIYAYIAFSRSRRSIIGPLAHVPIRVRSASNPGNIGHLWVKERFVKAQTRRPGVIFIPGTVADNPGLDVDEYRKTMQNLPAAMQAQLLEGDWDAFHGAAFQVTEDHLVDHFPLADSHDRFECCDYGLNGAPWALIPVDYEGNLIFQDMLYVKNLLASEVAALVLEKRNTLWGMSNLAYADPSVWHRAGMHNKWGAPTMLADLFTDAGTPIIPANNDPRAGLMQVGERLNLDPTHPFPPWHPRAGEMGAPRVFFHRHNVGRLIEELRAAPLQPVGKRDSGEIVDPEWESTYGHSVAMARYACLVRPSASKTPPPENPHLIPPESEEALKAAWLAKVTAERNNESSNRDYVNV